MSSFFTLRSLGCTVEQTPHMTVEQGIRMTRAVFPRLYIDNERTKAGDDEVPDLIECIKRYRRHINKQTGVAGAPLHDIHSNGADALRYVALNADTMPTAINQHQGLAAAIDLSQFNRRPATSAGY